VRLYPGFNRIDGVPAVLVIVSNDSAKEDTCPDAGNGHRNRRADFAGGERTASITQANPPPPVATTPHSHNSTRNRRARSPDTQTPVARGFRAECLDEEGGQAVHGSMIDCSATIFKLVSQGIAALVHSIVDICCFIRWCKYSTVHVAKPVHVRFDRR
jgi:hypothetical protein